MLSCSYNVSISRSKNKDFYVYFVVTYSGLSIVVYYGCLSCSYMYIVVMRRKLSYRKDDCAMHPINGCPENFREPLNTPMATFPESFNSLLFRSIFWICMRTQFEVRSFTHSWDNKGTPKIWGAPGFAHAPYSPKFLKGFCSYGPSEYICQIWSS